MNVFDSDPISSLAFSMHENKGVYALLVGSGVSRSSGIPTGWEITLDLIRRVAAVDGVEDEPDWEAWYLDRYDKAPDYSDLVKAVARTPTERRSILDRYIEPTESEAEQGLKQFTEAHTAIADLVKAGYVRVILTTNFDRHIENAVRAAGIEPTVVSSVDTLKGAEPLTHSSCYIFKVHGDYKDARILNTDEELSRYPKPYNTLLDRVFDEFGLIIAGWSGKWDTALIKALERAPNRRYSTYWALRDSSIASATDLIKQRHATVIEIASADEFFPELKNRVLTLEKSRHAQPQSLALLTSSVKRYLSKPEFKIELSDLIDDQLGQLLSNLDTDILSPNGSWSNEEFKERITLYEQLTEPMAYVTGLLGRFGADEHFEHVADVLNSVYSKTTESMGGLTVWLNIRSYPAVLIFYAFGLSLLRAKRFKALYRLFQHKLPSRRSDALKPLVERLFLWDWEGHDNDMWRRYDESYARKKTALSDHLHELFSGWSAEITGRTPDFEMLFEEFELLASLAHFMGNDESEIEKAFTSEDPDQVKYFRTPFGRVGWDSRCHTALAKRLEDQDYLLALSNAGFGKYDPFISKYFMRKFDRVTSNMRW